MRVGILTYHRARNYGAYLQAYGLCQRLNQEIDIDAEIIDFQMCKEFEMYNLGNFPFIKKLLRRQDFLFQKQLTSSFDQALSSLPLSSDYLCSDDIKLFKNFVSNKYDIIIVGSDELWKVDGYRGFPTPYWLPDNYGCIKVSYAVSSRNYLSDISLLNQNKIKKYLNDFKIVSVRDNITKFQIGSLVENKKKLHIYSDPSFVFDYSIDKKDWCSYLLERAKVKKTKKIAIVMTENKYLAKLIRKKYNNQYHLISVFHRQPGYINVADLTPFEWLNTIASADFVFSSYFHAICFSIINDVPFLAIGTPNKNDKLADLISKTHNQDHYISFFDLQQNEDLIMNIISKAQKNPNNRNFIITSRKNFKEFVKELKALKD